MKLKVLIDSITLLSPLAGIGRYTYEISKHIKEDTSLDIDFYYGYCSKELIYPSEKSTLRKIKSLLIQNQFIKKIIRKILLALGNVTTKNYDIYWQPSLVPNDKIKAKYIITTVHDFSFILYKDCHPKERIEYLEDTFFKNIIKSDIIITVSAFTKQEVMSRINISEDKIKVIHNGIDHTLFYQRDDVELNYTLPEKFIFCVGSIEPRKNLIGLLKAYELLGVEVKKEYKLVLAGFKGWENKEIMAIINKNKENIHYLGFISDLELSKTYNRATCFVYPSFYEGFGIPPLEAMACGTPVIVSRSSSIPEVCGDAALYVDPNNTEEITEKITNLLLNVTLQEELIIKGLERVKKYTWEKSVQKHLKIIKDLSISDKNKSEK